MSIQAKVDEMIQKISTALEKNDNCSFSTCDCPYYGWDSEAHHAMHILAKRGVPERNWRFIHKVSHEVTDWTVINEDAINCQGGVQDEDHQRHG